MTKHKTNIAIVFTAYILMSLSWALGFQTPTYAEQYILEQVVTNPSDACPNIPGTQSTIPSGMQIDSNGDCYTPVTPPVTTDLCNNLNGMQTTLPSGYYRTISGNCYLEPEAPAPPVDVCSNIDNVQISVPDGYYLDETNTCVKIPDVKDVCLNIGGPQETVPEGMNVENGTCFTPETEQPTNNPSSTNHGSNGVPAIFQPAVDAITSVIPENVKVWLRALPNDTAKAVPYYIFLIVAILALIPILQSIREAMFARQITAILKRERDVAEQKDNFVALATHYLRTPLTLLGGSVDNAVALNELTLEAILPLKTEISNLSAKIESVLQSIQQNTALNSIGVPGKITPKQSVIKSAWFWGPIIGSILLTLIANFLLVVVGGKQLGVTDTFFHFLIAIIAFFILYLGVRNLYIQKRLHEEQQTLILQEKTIDETRNSFISSTTLALKEGLERVDSLRQLIQNTSSEGHFNEGRERIEAILRKFLLLEQIQTGAERNIEVIDLYETFEASLLSHDSEIAAKNLTITNRLSSPFFIRQNRLLFSFLVDSLIDNAIKFNKKNGTIEISTEPNQKTVVIKITDNGIGIDEEKLDRLFKPFSRATSALEFNYEGLGFSLFLGKIIMNYTGGNIVATSVPNEGTQLVVNTPLGTHT